MTRRQLTMLAAAAAPLSAEAPIRIAFLGTSHSHAEGKMQVVRSNPAFQLVTGLSEAQVLADATIAAVAVEGDVKSNAASAQRALDAGKHVHLEKPPAATLAEFQQLLATAARRKRVLQLGYMWRYNPAVNKAMALARSGQLGAVYALRAQMNTVASAAQRAEWGRFQGGDMFEQGSHLMDMFVRLMGRPTRVLGILRSHGPQKDGFEDNVAAVVDWPGATGILTAATLQPGATAHRFFEIQGTRGTATVRPLEPPVLHLDLDGKRSEEKFEYTRYIGDFEELAACIRTGKPLSVTPEQDLWATEALLQACGPQASR
jgi:predicted dehydrogenase